MTARALKAWLLAFFLNHINKKADAANKFLFQNEKPFEIDANNIIALDVPYFRVTLPELADR